MTDAGRDRLLFLDANVLMYALGREHPYREPCRKVLRRIEALELRAVTSVEVLQELLHRYRSLGQHDRASYVYQFTRDLCVEILPVTGDDLDDAHQILARDPEISVRDAVHAATARNRGLTEILSTDRHLDDIEGIVRVDPASID